MVLRAYFAVNTTKEIDMLIELVTPLILATAPTTVIVQDTDKYSHQTQMIAKANINDELSYTGGGTRTYDYTGKPWDNDND
jgi:hypothetical protein